MSRTPEKHPGYLPLPIDKLPANKVVPIEMYIYMPMNGKMLLYKEEEAVLGPARHARMHEFRDRFFYKREDQPKLEAFLKANPGDDVRPMKSLMSNPHFLSGAASKEELQSRSAKLLCNHFGFTPDETSDESITEQMQKQINQVTAGVLEVLEVDAGVLDKLKAVVGALETSGWNHSANVAGISALLALAIGYTDKELLRDIATGGYLHDIGLSTCNLPMRARELNYTPVELERYRQHPAAGLELLEILELGVSENVKIIVYQHEEWHDGGGFPQGAQGADLFEPAQLVAIASKIDHLIRTDLPGFVAIDEAMRKIGEENGAGGGACEFNPGLLNQIFDAVFSGGAMVSSPLASYG
ncbi:MAG: HD domain-containing protein [Deltaproteobacteria bacterium]|nr:HD domain-containing protein [Deltaproteobacteria bacterium]